MSERASKQMSTAERLNKASSVEQVNEWVVWVNEQTDEQVARYLRLDSWLFWTTVGWSQTQMGIYWKVKTIKARDKTERRPYSLGPL